MPEACNEWTLFYMSSVFSATLTRISALLHLLCVTHIIVLYNSRSTVNKVDKNLPVFSATLTGISALLQLECHTFTMESVSSLKTATTVEE